MPLLDVLERHSDAYTITVVVAFVLSAVVFYIAGRKAEKRFKDQGEQPVRFRERGASGHSQKSAVTKLGGANGVLEVVVTDQ